MKRSYTVLVEHLSRSAQKNYFSFLFVLLSSICFGQTSNINGIVNTYHKVIQVIPSKACLRVADPTGLNVNTMVMVVQIKGATINTANNSSFGDTISVNGAGNYEIGTICYIIGDSVFLFHQLLNTYDSSSKVQLVQFAEYYSANVVGTIKPAPWDSVAGTGGVIALYAEEDLTLNAQILADSSGNSGGVFTLSDNNCSNLFAATGYVYNPTVVNPQEGAYKGEGIANLTIGQSGGRGAPANGGGGGNNHNNSGGGGANLTIGGIGGGNTSASGCNTNLRGLAGKPLNSSSGKKIFFGGGGGSGHSNNGSISSNYGGNGGGLIFIWANNLIGNNDSITANGGDGGTSAADGAGGGGAGGTIIMNVANYTGNVFIRTNGGKGGQSDNGFTNQKCYGGGGGGSGGAIYFSTSTAPVTKTSTGGSGGASINPFNCTVSAPGGAGTAGNILFDYVFPRSTNPAGYCR
ncbi:MAG TPA: hypothetical protein VMZ03_06935, partial [Chitinophagaceae bacterium]|nr:hypothetical protein [Chitinophagaceae bacterium]